MTLTVGVNLLWLVPDGVGGSEESTVASLRALADQADDDLSIRLYALRPFARAHPDLVDAFPTDLLPQSGESRLSRIVAEASWLAAHTRGCDLVHHAGGTAPPVRGAPYVLTVHDLQPLEAAATHGPLKRGYLSVAIPRSVQRARHVVVPSEFVRRTVVSRFRCSPEKVTAVPHGVEVLAEPTEPAELVSRLRLDGPVVLWPAITYPHKNHRVLVAAFAEVLHRHPDAVLVLPGNAGSEEERVQDQIRALGITSRVRRTGRLPAADIAGLYRLASVVAVPSRYEGFGLPAAEAMAYGVPVVASDVTALPEVVGDAGVLVGPDDVAGWTEALNLLLDSRELRARLGETGRSEAQRYTWAANARTLTGIYRAAAR